MYHFGNSLMSMGSGSLGSPYSNLARQHMQWALDQSVIQGALDAMSSYPPSTAAAVIEGPIELDGPPITATAVPSAEYREKLRKVGATALLSKISADEEVQAFQNLVIESGLRFYSRERVESYLLQSAKEHLIEQGKKPEQYGVSWRLSVEWLPLSSYTMAIPMPVLDTIERIHDAHPTAAFFISEVKQYPDPFLMVKLHGHMFIIERWDEPAYREE